MTVRLSRLRFVRYQKGMLMLTSHRFATLASIGLLHLAAQHAVAQQVHTRIADAEKIAQQTGRPVLAIAGAKT